jgi:hypothetical protein
MPSDQYRCSADGEQVERVAVVVTDIRRATGYVGIREEMPDLTTMIIRCAERLPALVGYRSRQSARRASEAASVPYQEDQVMAGSSPEAS